MKCNLVAATLTTLVLAIHLTGVRCRPPGRIQACGKELADILNNTCLGGYNTYFQGGKDGNQSNGTRKKRGITQECCLQSCSMKDILEYCSGGPPINATELLSAVDSSPKTSLRLFPDNTIDVDTEDASGGASNAPSTPPPPLGQRANPAAKAPPSQEPHENVTPKSSGVHSTTPWFRGKTPALVVIIGSKFNLGSRITYSKESRPNSTNGSKRALAMLKQSPDR